MNELFELRKPLDVTFLIYFVVILVAAITSTFAEFYHTSHPEWTYGLAFAVSMGFVIVEYALSIYGNRVGRDYLSTMQLQLAWNGLQLLSFLIVLKPVYGQSLQWNHGVATALIFAAAVFANLKT